MVMSSSKGKVFGYLSIILAPFGTVFAYFWLKECGNPAIGLV